MAKLLIDAARTAGRVKPMHAVNNGPVYKFTEDQRITNIDAFRKAGIPYARTHDAAFYSSYGGEHCVDILAVFPNFDADPEDPASYDFTLTDEYMRVMIYADVEPFYRLGSKIEHWPKKYGTLVPKDFRKWAVIAEHIIAHYTEGFADGFHYKMEYWEIWNEPDGAADDADPIDKKCWSGTRAQFCEFFDVVAKHLKTRFPHLKIGGPAVCYPVTPWVDAFLSYLREHKTPLDFFSWHVYASTVEEILKAERGAREILDRYGYTEAESILNEWNYVKGWTGDEWVYSLRTEKNLKGASFVAGTIARSQYEPLDFLMYYDARPCAMNGLFSTDIVSDKLKGYYPFLYFGELYRLGTAVPVACDDARIYAAAARSEEALSLMLTHYEDADAAETVKAEISFSSLPFSGPFEVTCRVLDEAHDDTPLFSQRFDEKKVALTLGLPLFTTVLVTVNKA